MEVGGDNNNQYFLEEYMHDKSFAKICKTTLTYRRTPLEPVLLK